MSDQMLTVAGCAVLGLLAGSFLTVVIERVPQRRSIVTPGSTCPNCGRRLGPIELIPIVSYVAQRGSCRGCGNRIGVEALVIEATTAIAFAVTGWRFGPDVVLVPYLIFVATLVAQTAIDFRLHRLPREITYTAFGLSLGAMVIIAVTRDDWVPLWRGVLAAAAATAVMLGIYLASRGGLGDGDVRLTPLLGLHLGYLGWVLVPVGLFAGFFFGACVGVAAMVIGRAGPKTQLPFGPFLALGALVTIWWIDPSFRIPG